MSTKSTFLALLLVLTLCHALPTGKDVFNLTVIHINDFHAHFEQNSVHTSRCTAQDEADQKCFGGVARVYQKQWELRQEDPDAIFLNAGDFYQGTVWYTKFKHEPMAIFGNKVNYTAMGVGNHDFDDHIDGFVPFAEKVDFPLLAANIDSTGAPEFEKYYNKSTVIEVKGKRIGIIGYITRSTAYNFPQGTLKFTDEVESVRKEAKRLKEDGIGIIIALGHSGYDLDQVLAEEIPELDLVVGGHSHTFLYTLKDGEELPSIETPRGDYPTFVTNNKTKKIIPVVQAYCYTKYLGHLVLQFDDDGDLLEPVDGNGVSYAKPILLDHTVDQNQEVLDMMVEWKNNLTEFYEVIGINEQLLEEKGVNDESNIGDVITDSMTSCFNDTMIAFTNNGGIRSSIPKGNITYEDVLYVLPFDNTVDKIIMSGDGLKISLENAVSNISVHDVEAYPGFGYQLTGLRVTFTLLEDNVGERVTELKVKQEDGTYSDVDSEKNYTVALSSFLAGSSKKEQKQLRAEGIFSDQILDHEVGTMKIYEAFRDWIKANSPIIQDIEGRFTFIVPSPTTDNPNPPTDNPNTSTDNPNTPTDNPNPTTDNPNPTTENPNPPTDNPNTPTDNPNPTTDNPNPTTDNPNPTTDNPNTSTDNPNPTTDNPNSTTTNSPTTTPNAAQKNETWMYKLLMIFLFLKGFFL